MKSVILSLALVSTALCSDCIPLTFRKLSETSGAKVSYEIWAKELMPDGKTSPQLGDAVASWQKHFPDRPLVCIYSTLKDMPYEDREITHNTSYLWIGLIPEKLAADPSKRDEAHSAILVILKDKRYKIVHTLDPEGKQYFIEYLSEEEFFKRTLIVYQVVEKKP